MFKKLLKHLWFFSIIDEWSKWERRKIGCRIVERQRPGRRHTASEWNALADKAIAKLERDINP